MKDVHTKKKKKGEPGRETAGDGGERGERVFSTLREVSSCRRGSVASSETRWHFEAVTLPR